MTPKSTLSPSLSPLSSEQLMEGPDLREFILLAGKDSVGKSCAIVSLACLVEQMQPKSTFHVIDTENKFRSAMRSFDTDAPHNIAYYKTPSMNAITEAVELILQRSKPYDWLAVESMSRVWEMAQDMGYQEVSGMGKASYLNKWRNADKKGGPVPKPDDLWSIVKGAHNGAFLDLLVERDDLNIIISTTIAKPPKEGGFMKENADRKALRVELGIDAGIEGAPRLPYYPESLCMLDLKGGNVSCKVLRDNLSIKDDSRIEFDVPTRKDWAPTFWSLCR